MAALTDRIRVVVDDILAVTTEGGRMDPETAPYSLEDMLNTVVEGMQYQARPRGIHIKIHPPVEPDFPREVYSLVPLTTNRIVMADWVFQILTDAREWKGVLHR